MRAIVFSALLLLTGCGYLTVYRDTDAPISSKAVFEPTRYLGVWHEVARFPVPFEAGCVGVTAEYGLRDDGLLSVLNICRNAEGHTAASFGKDFCAAFTACIINLCPPCANLQIVQIRLLQLHIGNDFRLLI